MFSPAIFMLPIIQINDCAQHFIIVYFFLSLFGESLKAMNKNKLRSLHISNKKNRRYSMTIAKTAHTHSLVIFILFSVIFTVNAEAQINAVYTDTPIRLDGFLNEPAWEAIEPITDFIQRELIEGAPVSERTELRIMHDRDNLYIGVICYDREPEKIIHKELLWDSGLLGDDYITFILDTYNDKRTGYYFSVNPNGATYDGTFETGDAYANGNWDGIWDTRARITDTGWSCEIIMPFKTLKFPATDIQSWGFNFRRKIRRKNELSLWRAWKRNEGIMQLSKAGTLHIDGAVDNGIQLDTKPYLLSGANKEANKDIDNTLKYGLDLRYGLTSNTTLDLTTKTDFAQIESDKDVINLTRYSLRYPEKREFFLENAELFAFSQGMTNLFYSRRIGISEDRMAIPILGGAKLAQKSGSFNMGIMTMQTEESGGTPSTNYSVVRVKKDLWEQSHIGFIGTSVLDADGHDNQVYGADFVYRTNSFLGDRNFEVQSYLTGSVTDGRAHENMAGRIFIHYPDDLMDTFFVYHAIGNKFNPELGFISGKDPGVQQYMYVFDFTPRTSIPGIKKLTFQPLYFNYYADTRNELISRTVKFSPFGFITDADDRFDVSIQNSFDLVDEAYGSLYGSVIPLGGHEWWSYSASGRSSQSRPVAFSLSTGLGDFYNGTRENLSTALTLKANMHYSISADMRYNNITVDGTKLITREYGSRLIVNFTSRISANTFLQYNNETEKVNMNFRFHYIPKIGSDIYIVYNHLMDENDRFRTLQNAGMLKINITYRI